MVHVKGVMRGGGCAGLRRGHINEVRTYSNSAPLKTCVTVFMIFEKFYPNLREFSSSQVSRFQVDDLMR